MTNTNQQLIDELRAVLTRQAEQAMAAARAMRGRRERSYLSAAVVSAEGRNYCVGAFLRNCGLGHSWCPGKDSNLHGR